MCFANSDKALIVNFEGVVELEVERYFILEAKLFKNYFILPQYYDSITKFLICNMMTQVKDSGGNVLDCHL